MATAVHSLEEEEHLAIVKLRELPNQAAIVKRRGRPPVRFRPETVQPAVAWPELTDSFVGTTRASSPYISTALQAETEIAARFDTMTAKAAPAEPGKFDPNTFWAE